MSMQLLLDGLKAMILGMGTVYVFLIIMILIMILCAKVLRPYAGFFEKDAAPKRKPADAGASGASSETLAAAAVEAVRLFRSEKHSAGDSGVVAVPVNGKTLNVEVRSAGAAAPAAAPAAKASSGSGALREIKSPLPGTIVRIEASAGSTFAAGDVLAVIEAMKMETEIKAENAGTVRQVLVNSKDVVTADQVIFTVEESK